jgi:hypothetical protein
MCNSTPSLLDERAKKRCTTPPPFFVNFLKSGYFSIDKPVP